MMYMPKRVDESTTALKEFCQAWARPGADPVRLRAEARAAAAERLDRGRAAWGDALVAVATYRTGRPWGQPVPDPPRRLGRPGLIPETWTPGPDSEQVEQVDRDTIDLLTADGFSPEEAWAEVRKRAIEGHDAWAAEMMKSVDGHLAYFIK